MEIGDKMATQQEKSPKKTLESQQDVVKIFYFLAWGPILKSS